MEVVQQAVRERPEGDLALEEPDAVRARLADGLARITTVNEIVLDSPYQELQNVDESVEQEAVEATTWGEGPWEEVGEDFTDEKIAELTSLN